MSKFLCSLVFVFFFSCSEYRHVTAPLNSTKPYIKWYFFERVQCCRDELKLNYSYLNDAQLDSFTNREVGRMMLNIKPADYQRIEQAYKCRDERLYSKH